MSASWVFLLISIVWLLMLFPATANEERYCRSKYGYIYNDYNKQTLKWIGVPIW